MMKKLLLASAIASSSAAIELQVILTNHKTAVS